MNAVLPALLVLAWLSFPSAKAGESYDNCSGFIDSIPATITTQGVWCLRADLSTAIASGSAITIATNNVTLDCNDFKLGGLAGGAGTLTRGVVADGRLNATIRNCNIRGFWIGIGISAGGGHVIEDSRLEANRYAGIVANADNSTIRRNLVLDTGGSTQSGFAAFGLLTISVSGLEIIDNTFSGFQGTDANAGATAIYIESADGGSIRGNRIRDLQPMGTGVARGIALIFPSRLVIRDNDIQGPGTPNSVGIACSSGTSIARDNIVSRFNSGILSCTVSGNLIHAG